jgi:hypothetical protein
MKDCNLMKNFLGGAMKNKPLNLTRSGAAKHDNNDDFPKEYDVVMMIFGGTPTHPPKRKNKRILQEIYHVEPLVPSYLRWSETAITYNRTDHPDHIPQLRAYPRVVAPLFVTKRVHKVLMDRRSGHNIIYASTLDDMGISWSQLRPSSTPFHGVIPGMEAVPLRQIDLPVTFGTTSNFCKETFTFEVVGFPGTYHAILGRPAYAKFMAVSKYTYLKLKMSRPKGVIAIYTKFQHAYECNTECFQFTETLIRSEKIAAKPTTVDLDDPTIAEQA